MIYKRNTVGGNMAYLILKEMIIENFKNIDKKTITFDSDSTHTLYKTTVTGIHTVDYESKGCGFDSCSARH